ncbi:MAG: hypothetical protein UMS36scaffold28_30 [Phage 59_13]|nr:MAG: hypothetical protein UMS36scaffold28_30 [Phage 59_13]
MPYLDMVGSFIYQEPVFRAKLDALAENDAALKLDGWAQNTKTVFYQPTTPTGWTQDVSQNDKALRVVGSVGGGGSGGSQAISSTIVLAHSHALATPAAGTHTHTYSDHTHQLGPSTSSRDATDPAVYDDAGFMHFARKTSGGSSFTALKGPWKSPGAITLGTEPDHNHGAPASSLVDFIFQYADVIIGTKDAVAGTYIDLTSYWSSGTKVDFDPFQEYANNDAYNLNALMPAGTMMVFGQASAPTGWTKAATINDRMLRVVSAVGGGVGGNQVISATVLLMHTHVVTAAADHSHSVPNHQHSLDTDGSTIEGALGNAGFDFIQESATSPGFLALAQLSLGLPTSTVLGYKTTTTNSGSGSTDAGGGHSHTLISTLADFTLAYCDVIQCAKDSTGAPNAYVDMTAVFAWKRLVSYQRLNNLAKSDSYIQYHTTPSGTKAYFFMATPPVGWTKLFTQHDKALRVVSGGSGGSPGGGAQLLSSVFPLAHTHDVQAQANHTHAATHTHPVDSGNKTLVPPGSLLLDTATSIGTINTVGSFHPDHFFKTVSEVPTEAPVAAGNHDHGGVTDSQLTDTTLAYADVIYCQKD